MAGMACLGLTLAGVASSAGGIFGFPAAVVLVALHRYPLWKKIAWAGLFLVGFALTVWLLPKGNPLNLDVGRILIVVPTALGGALIGTETGVNLNPPTLQFLLGWILVGLIGFLGWKAAATKQLHAYAFSAALIVFGFLCLAAIAVGRPYLGNWHLQYILPALLGLLAALSISRCLEARPTPRRIWVSITAAVGVLSLVGTLSGFFQHGPTQAAYTGKIGTYANTALMQPDQEAPYPGTGGWNLDRNMILFLSAVGNDHFRPENERWRAGSIENAPLSPEAIIVEAPPSPLVFEGPDAAAEAARAVARLPQPPDLFLVHLVLEGGEAHPGAIVLREGSTPKAVLRRVDPRLVLTGSENVAIYSGFIPQTEIPLLSKASSGP